MIIGDFQLDQHLDPVGEVDLHLLLTHRDESYWRKSENFDPGRRVRRKCALRFCSQDTPVHMEFSIGKVADADDFPPENSIAIGADIRQAGYFSLIELDLKVPELTYHRVQRKETKWVCEEPEVPTLLRVKPVHPMHAESNISAGRRFSIGSFKSLPDQDIELGVVNVFIGANGSGKSNILEALGVLGSAVTGRVDDASLLRAGVRPGVPALYKSAFPTASRQDPHIKFRFEVKNAAYQVTLHNSLEEPGIAWRYKTEDFISYGGSVASRGPRSPADNGYGLATRVLPELSEGNPLRKCLENLRGYTIYSPSTQVMRGLIPDSQPLAPLGLSGGNLAEAVELLQNIVAKDEDKEDLWEDLLGLIEWMASLDISSSASKILSGSVNRPKKVLRFTDRFMKKGRNRFTAYDASEGALYILFFAVLALHPEAPAGWRWTMPTRRSTPGWYAGY